MGYYINKDEVQGEEISPGVVRRVLLPPEQNGGGPSGDLTVTHYTLTEGGVLTLDKPGVEYLDYIISGAALIPRRARTRYYFSNTTLFVAPNKIHSYVHAGESDLCIISHEYTVSRPSFQTSGIRIAELSDYWREPAPMSREFLGLIGAQRINLVTVQLWDRDEHTNPEETCYFMRGSAEMIIGDKRYKLRPGSLAYIEKDEIHAIRNTSEKGHPMHYLVLSYIEQDKMWSERGYQGKV